MMTPIHPILAGLDPSVQARISREARRLDLAAGQKVFEAGSLCQGLPLVLGGCIRLQMTACSGQEITLYRISDGDVCPLSLSALMQGEGYRAEAIVEEDARVIILPFGLFDDLMAASAPFRRQILGFFSARLDTLMLLVEQVAFRRMDQRLANWLRDRAGQGPTRITHQALAAELGTAREVVSRLLKGFERNGYVTLARGEITVIKPPPAEVSDCWC
ncbi:Crp/Fnr family transcriptional regulator [Plastorhodobacter daqingensis]|uniref:Crp/Fnr family transcriptional regulator n=1 Tax=Plastorhodobacter daqingensis TaxID=1387281 RepID=A0ABW2UM10_9RHOB